MRLLEALKIVRSAPQDADPYRLQLACGYQPLHLTTFLLAHLTRLRPERKIEIHEGRYGDLYGNAQRTGDGGPPDATVAVIEWADLDPRLGVRQLGGWTPTSEADVVGECRRRLDALADVLTAAADTRPVACALPTLPLPPFAHTPPWQASATELALNAALHAFAVRIVGTVRVLGTEELDRRSPPGYRRDVKSELASGFPYHLAHADHLATLLALMLAGPTPKKALITDLDGCLWSGIVGDDGVGGVHWDLDHHAQVHGLYQQLLASLAEAGVLLAVASRNDPEVVERALGRPDLLVERDRLFPVEATWGPKSRSVAEIIARWHVGADSVVFVDDSPLELAEVKAAHPAIECLQFHGADPALAYPFFFRLRELFGRQRITDEDHLRSRSLRHAATVPSPSGGAGRDAASIGATFLAETQAELTFTRLRPPPEPRALDLINKSNQFNLNGRRHEEARWRRRLDDPEGVHLCGEYRDKFGTLGKIAILSGRLHDHTLHVDIWVMSCRAFGRQVEHAALRHLFQSYPIRELVLDFQPTPRNQPMQELLRFYVGELGPGPVSLSRDRFLAKCPPLIPTEGLTPCQTRFQKTGQTT
jgi:FkbH-like protein